MQNNSLRNQAFFGAIWKFFERSLAQIVSFVVSIILARLLLPEDYGLIAIVTMFTTICDKLIVCGFATSLIQKKDADNLDFSSVSIFILASSALLYCVLFVTAPLIAKFFNAFNYDLLVKVLRISGINLFIVAVNSVQHAYVSRQLKFRYTFVSKLASSIFSALVGILLAVAGMGVWALVAQSFTLLFCDTICLALITKWFPGLRFSLLRLKSLFSYGWKIFCASIIKTLYNDLRGFVIGKVYSPSDLAFYNRGQTFPQLIESNITGTIDSVFFPAVSKMQSSKEDMRTALSRAIKVSSFLIMPCFACIAAVASPLVDVLLTDKWAPCVIYIQILSFSFLFSSIETENLQAIKAAGRSDIVLNLEIVKKVIGILILILTTRYGVEAIAYGMLASQLFAVVANMYPNIRLLDYGLLKQVEDFLPYCLLSMICYIVVRYFVASVQWTNIFLLITGIIVFLLMYISLCYIFKLDSLKYIYTLFCQLKKRNK